MPQPDRETRYALAGALSVTSAELLQQVHRVAGRPAVDVESLSAHDQQLALAAAQARSAVAACSALVAQLLTTLDPQPHEEATTARVVNAARAAVAAAADQWRGSDASEARKIKQLLRQLFDYVDRLAASGPFGGSSTNPVSATN